MKVKNVFKNFFYLDEEDDYDYVEQSSQEPAQKQVEKVESVEKTQKAPRKKAPVAQQEQVRKPMATQIAGKNNSQRKKNNMPVSVENDYAPLSNVVSFTQKTSKVGIFEPLVYSEAQDIGDCLKNKKAAIVNLQRIERSQGKRIIDFLSGTIFALNGDIKQVGTNIFLCTPDNVEVDGTISDYHFDE